MRRFVNKGEPVNFGAFSKNYFSTVFTYLSRYLKDNDKMIKVFDYVNFRPVKVFRWISFMFDVTVRKTD